MDEVLGLAQNTYQRWESGSLPREDERITQLANIFGVEVGELFIDPELTSNTDPTIASLAAVISERDRKIKELEAQLNAKPEAATEAQKRPQTAERLAIDMLLERVSPDCHMEIISALKRMASRKNVSQYPAKTEQTPKIRKFQR
jgi:transcriptional regulator with XRE-family HTH domain